MRYWLMKSEPEAFGIDHLARAPGRRSGWDGVRNYQARNMLRDDFAAGDRAFFHHSSCAVPGIYGTMEIVRAGHPDPAQFDRRSRYYDAGSDPANPRWYQVEVRLLKKFARPVTLEALREHAGSALRNLVVLRRGNRLSVMPVSAEEWRFIHRLAREPDEK
ncbi:MAG: EVE domain-containing protein [Gammaproteobacteria bacterium]|nr:EVE domain-containing protein [Gammaproteobacteria bacterium]